MSSNKNTAKKEINKVEKKSKVPKYLGLLLVIGVALFGAWYFLSNPSDGTSSNVEPGLITSGNPQTPTEAYKKLFAAVKSKNTEEIKSLMTKDSMGLAQMQAGKSNQEIATVLANAFTTTTMSDKLPAIRDERIKGKFGAIEVFSQKKNVWEDLPFIAEDGAWKLAVGNLFAGNFESPGKPRSMIERENANKAGKRDLVPYGKGNVNMNVKPKIIDPLKNGQKVTIPADPKAKIPAPVEAPKPSEKKP